MREKSEKGVHIDRIRGKKERRERQKRGVGGRERARGRKIKAMKNRCVEKKESLRETRC